jgi:hypothetical protein
MAGPSTAPFAKCANGSAQDDEFVVGEGEQVTATATAKAKAWNWLQWFPDLQVREIGSTRVRAAMKESGRALLDTHPLAKAPKGRAPRVVIFGGEQS